MGRVVIRCPATGQTIPTGIEADHLKFRLFSGLLRRCLLPDVQREPSLVRARRMGREAEAVAEAA
jgi:hypothetical protein